MDKRPYYVPVREAHKAFRSSSSDASSSPSSRSQHARPLVRESTLHPEPAEVRAALYLPVWQRRPERLSYSGPDTGGNPYGVMVEKFGGPVRRPGTVDEDDDHDGPFTNITSRPYYKRPVRRPGTFTNITARRSAPIVGGVTRSPGLLHVPSNMLETIHVPSSRPQDIPLQDLKEMTDKFSYLLARLSYSGPDTGGNPYGVMVEKFARPVRRPGTVDEDDDHDGPFTNITSRRSAPIDDGVTRAPDLLHVPSNMLETILQDGSSRPQDIPLQDLKEITDNFSDDRILGQGGFGVVYKGVLRNGKMIAVKKIVSSLMPGLQKQFESEVYHLMMLKHPNIVRCVGYCYEIQNACLEYNGKYVFAETAERLLCLE